MTPKRPAFVFDLDGTLNHAAPAAGGLPVRGRTTNSQLMPEVLERLADLSRRVDLFAATGRAETTVTDIRELFARFGVTMAGWILEHGAVVENRPEWTTRVLEGIDLPATHSALEALIRERGFPIDADRYRHDHRFMILLSGDGALPAEHFLDVAAPILKGRFRTIAGRRKIAILPKRAEKYRAFMENFGDTHRLVWAAGDQPDDLVLLQQAALPLTLTGADPAVCDYVAERNGFVSSRTDHYGTLDMLAAVTESADRPPTMNAAVPPLPDAASEWFRPSRQAYRQRLFDLTPPAAAVPDAAQLDALAARIGKGADMVIEVRMRDWGGEVKPLTALMRGLIPFLPAARWRLVFRPERCGRENLTDMTALFRKLPEAAFTPFPRPFLTAPGVPGSPPEDGPASVVLRLHDYPEDIGPYYDLVAPRLITRHPEMPNHWFVNPMFLKTAGTPTPGLCTVRMAGARVLMAANLIGPTDIHIAVDGFARLRGLFDALIIAPRVVTNPDRNRAIDEAVARLGERPVRLSEYTAGRALQVLKVDTYGDLAELYPLADLTYLGGGFNVRKRGFDPMESLMAGVPVVTGPLCDYNRVTVRALAPSGWVTGLADRETAPADFRSAARTLIRRPPEKDALRQFIAARSQDPLRVAAEILADLSGRREGYLLPEHRCFAQERLDWTDLMDAARTTPVRRRPAPRGRFGTIPEG